MAPFAFLGSEYDAALTEFYTTTSSLNIFRMLSIVPQLLGGESLADTGPLRLMIEQQVDAELLRRIADAHNSGQRLYIATVDLDSQRVWIWNMGLIAASGRPEAGTCSGRSCWLPPRSRSRFRRCSSTSRPAAGASTRCTSTAGSAPASSSPAACSASRRAGRRRSRSGREEVYIIHNGQLLPSPDTTPRSLRSIALRTFESASKSAVVGDLFRIYAVTLRDRPGSTGSRFPRLSSSLGTSCSTRSRCATVRPGAPARLTESPWFTDPPGLRWSASP